MICSLYGITRMYIDVLEKCATFLDHPVYVVYHRLIRPPVQRSGLPTVTTRETQRPRHGS